MEIFDIENHGGSYKRTFLERHLQSLIETFRPLEMDLYDIKELLTTIEPYIKKLEVTELLPPIVYLTPADQEADDDFEGASERETSAKSNSSSRSKPRNESRSSNRSDGSSKYLIIIMFYFY